MLLIIERTSYTGKEEPVYVQKRYYRPDRVQYRLTLSRYGEQSGGSKIDAFRPVFGE